MKRLLILIVATYLIVLMPSCSTIKQDKYYVNLDNDKDVNYLIEQNNKRPDFSVSLILELNEIITIADVLANQKDIDSITQSELILKMRNELDELYSRFFLRFRQNIESQLLDNLHKIALENKISYVRLEAVISIGIIRDKRSLPILSTIRENDKGELVRKYALEAINSINGINGSKTTAINYKNEIRDMVEILKMYETGEGRLF